MCLLAPAPGNEQAGVLLLSPCVCFSAIIAPCLDVAPDLGPVAPSDSDAFATCVHGYCARRAVCTQSPTAVCVMAAACLQPACLPCLVAMLWAAMHFNCKLPASMQHNVVHVPLLGCIFPAVKRDWPLLHNVCIRVVLQGPLQQVQHMLPALLFLGAVCFALWCLLGAHWHQALDAAATIRASDKCEHAPSWQPACIMKVCALQCSQRLST